MTDQPIEPKTLKIPTPPKTPAQAKVYSLSSRAEMEPDKIEEMRKTVGEPQDDPVDVDVDLQFIANYFKKHVDDGTFQGGIIITWDIKTSGFPFSMCCRAK